MAKVKQIRGYPDYLVSEEGKLFSTKRGFRELKLRKTNCGYWGTTLKVEGKRIDVMIHRLVAEAFIDNPENKQQVNHIDGNKNNNSVENLEWVTPSENQIHAYLNGLSNQVKGERHYNHKLTENQVLEIRSLFLSGWSKTALSKKFKVSRANIRKIIQRKTWKHV
ncbi:HNH endonuclease domain protein [Enterococcus faecalis 13-SD-W-01]|nr:HNH endonuclease domain protein [Enterococcus faecalis 13-SD-W-01]